VVRLATGRMDDTRSAVGEGCYGRRRVVWLAAGGAGDVGWCGWRHLVRTTTAGEDDDGWRGWRRVVRTTPAGEDGTGKVGNG
jgi:hypothetical protein